MLRDHGRDPSGEVRMWGLNSRLDNLQAAILNHKLTHYNDAIARRRDIARLYDDQLRELPQFVLPPAPDSDARHFDIFQNYEVEADDRDQLQSYLKKRGVGDTDPVGR
jgi:dTDP-4-amino-4,6-dideoxygalactose transaminase